MQSFDGFINLLKPPGMTSNDAVGFVRRLLPQGTKTGHGGTLDPDAAGVLPVCVGKATRLFDYIIDKRKTYIAELRLGVTTDTQDATGAIISRADAGRITAAQIQAALPHFVGRISQVPPAYSAIKRDGVRMYDLARKGEAVDLQPRPVTVHAIDYLTQTGADTHLIKVCCGKGVYIRTLCHDIGTYLGVGGHMAFLLRSEAGAFRVEDSFTPQELADMTAQGRLADAVSPMDMPLSAYPAVVLPPEYTDKVRNGCAIPPTWHTVHVNAGDVARVYVGHRFAGMAQADDMGNLRFRAMLLERD